jgi:hypothetical protein
MKQCKMKPMIVPHFLRRTAAVIACILSCSLTLKAADPATQPQLANHVPVAHAPAAASQPIVPASRRAAKTPLGASDPIVGDYCTILLAPKLQDFLQLDVTQRAKCAEATDLLHGMLENAASRGRLPRGVLMDARTYAKRVGVALDNRGEFVRDLLTAEQDNGFRKLFAERKLEPIEVASAEVHTTGLRAGRGNATITWVGIRFTKYGEAEEVTGKPTTAATGPSSKPTVNAQVTGRGISGTAHVERLEPPMNRRVSNQIQSVSDAVTLIAGDDGNARRLAAEWLTKADVDDARRSAVLQAIKPRLNEADTKVRWPLVQAYAHWSEAAQVSDLVAVVDFPEKVEGLTGQERCWGAAVAGLVRLDADAAEKCIDRRIDNFFFRVDTSSALKPLAEGNGPEHEAAARLLEKLKYPPAKARTPAEVRPGQRV